MQGDEGGEVQRRRPGDPDTYDETGRREDSKRPRAGVTGRWRPVWGVRARARRRRGGSDVSAWDQLCVSVEIQGFFFQWKDCLTEQLEAGRVWKGRDGGGLSLRVSLGAQGGPVPGSGIEGAEKGRQEPGPAGVSSSELGRAAPAFLFGPLVASGTSDWLRGIREAR